MSPEDQLYPLLSQHRCTPHGPKTVLSQAYRRLSPSRRLGRHYDLAELRYMAGASFHSSQRPAIHAVVREKVADDFEVVLSRGKNSEDVPTGKNRWLVSRPTGVR
jgi:hypothetical protein